jgi:hypothetical protein
VEILLPQELRSADELTQYVRGESPGKGAYSWEDAAETLVFDVPWEYEYDASMVILGWAYVDKNKKLRRRHPMRHPDKPWLRAWSIDDITRIGPRKGDTGGDNAKQKVKVKASTDLTVPRHTTRYEVSRITVGFRPLPFELVDDEQMGYFDDGEIVRYQTIESNPEAEFLTREGGSMKFATAPVAGNEIKTEIAVSEVKTGLTVTWERVPQDFICSAELEASSAKPWNGRIDKWETALNTVNEEVFLGCEIGTLLLKGYSVKRFFMPTMRPDGRSVPYLRLAAHFSHFDVTADNRGDIYHGHNTAPAQGNSYAYHAFSMTGALPQPHGLGKPRYWSTAFKDLYAHWDM